MTLSPFTPTRTTPRQRVIEAIRQGAPETASCAALRRHLLPHSDQVRDDALFDTELAALAPSRPSTPVVEPAAALATIPGDEALVVPAPAVIEAEPAPAPVGATAAPVPTAPPPILEPAASEASTPAGVEAAPADVMRRASALGNAGASMIAVARLYTRASIPVFPCTPTTKAPLTPGGFKDRTTDPAQVERWWTWKPDAVIGIVPGDFQMAAIDVDSAAAAAATVAAGITLDGFLVETAGKSKPFLYHGSTYPALHVFAHSTTSPSIRGAVLRHLGGYVIAAGSRMATGRVYTARSSGEPQQWPARSPLAAAASRASVEQESLLAPADEQVVELLRNTPNQTEGYDEWIALGIALRASVRDPEVGREAFVEFSTRDRWEGTSPEEAEAKWETFRGPFAVGWDALLDMARKLGANTARFDFPAVPPSTEPSLIESLNEEHALVVSRPGSVLWRRPGKDVQVVPLEHWRLLLKAEAPVGRQTRAEFWLTHPDRLLLENIVIDPSQPPLSVVSSPDGLVFNRWPGFATRPSADGSCDLILAYIRDVVCSGNAEHFAWVTQWLASMVQEPMRLPGTMLTLRGGIGVGKSTLTHIMARLVGPKLTLIEDKPGRLVGNFNAVLEGKVLVGMEEALFAGDKGAVGALKHLATSGTLMIEEKYEKARPIRSMVHVLMTTNEFWAVPAGQSERRFTVLDVGPSHQQDRAYFAALHHELEHGGAERFMHFLLNEVQIDWSLIARPLATQALLDQQLDSMSGLQAWWLECLRSGLLPGGGSTPPAEILFGAICHSLGDRYEAQRATQTKLGVFIQGLGATKVRPRTDGRRRWTYQFPPLAECRAAFAARLAVTPEWDEVEEWLPAEPLEAL